MLHAQVRTPAGTVHHGHTTCRPTDDPPLRATRLPNPNPTCKAEGNGKPRPSGSGSGPSPNRMLRCVFDSDGDTDPNTDARGKGNRPDRPCQAHLPLQIEKLNLLKSGTHKQGTGF